MVRRLARMGIPTALSNSVTAIGCMILQVTINGFGSTVVAAYTAASKVEQLTTQPTFTFGLAAATFTAQNAGAGKLDRVKDGVRKATVLNLIAGLAAAWWYGCLPRPSPPGSWTRVRRLSSPRRYSF